MRYTLTRQLEAYGYGGTAADFRDLLADAMFAEFPSWSDERLTRNPDEAKRYCELIRKSTGLPCLSDEFILGALTNIRRHSIQT